VTVILRSFNFHEQTNKKEKEMDAGDLSPQFSY